MTDGIQSGEHRVDDLLDALGVGIVVLDRHGSVQSANRFAREMLNAAGGADTVNQLFAQELDLVDEDLSPVMAEEQPGARTLRTGEPQPNRTYGLRSDSGAMTWFLAGTQPLGDPSEGAISGAICTLVDVTPQRAAQDALRSSEERFRLLAENAADMIFQVRLDPGPVFEYINPAVRSVLGYEPADFYGDSGFGIGLMPPEDGDRARKVFSSPQPAQGELDLPDHGVESLLLRMTRRDGVVIWVENRMVRLRDASGRVVAIDGIARDVTALKAKEADLSHRALHDPLTGLANRVLLLDRLERALARTRRHPSLLAVLFLDLDRFKTVNDNLGHEAGDRLLAVVARRLEDALRPSDSVARLGGDEFAAVLPDLHDAAEAMSIAERVLEAVAAPVDLGDGSLVATASIGLALATDGSMSASELLRRADFAMYAAKDGGRARIECYSAHADDGPASGGS